MKKKINTYTFPLILIFINLIFILYSSNDLSSRFIEANSPKIIVDSKVIGQTTKYIGATEAGGFYMDDLLDLGINLYRLWTDMAELEWWDDDDAQDGNWDDSEYGTPTIDEIKADSANGFENTIPWDLWDARFDEIQSWRYGTQTRREIIEALTNNDIIILFLLRTYNSNGDPEQRPGAEWAPRPPVDSNYRNEWWEHCFAVAYWLNVRNNYKIIHYEVLNEPDYIGQGWLEYSGNITDYTQLVKAAYDAISYANSFVGLPVYIHAPDVANYNSLYVSSILDNADHAVQVVDYHDYNNDIIPGINVIRSSIVNHNPDNIIEPIWNTEWGALWSSYDTLNRAMITASQLLSFSKESVEGITIFNMYDWDTVAGNDFGLIDLQADGLGGANRIRTETYYAYRLMIRGLVEAKDILQFNAIGVNGNIIVTRDQQKVYIIVINGGTTILVDVTAIGVFNGKVKIYEYSTVNKDIVVDNQVILSGQFTFTTPDTGISLAEITPVLDKAFNLTIEINPSQGGIIIIDPDKDKYINGENVLLTAIAKPVYLFKSWAGDVPVEQRNDNPLNIIMNSDKFVIANFLTSIKPPINFSGQKLLNSSLLQSEFINILSWQANPDNADKNIIKYRIYQLENGDISLLVEVDSNVFEYWHRKVDKDMTYNYVLVAVNDEGMEGNPANLTIQ